MRRYLPLVAGMMFVSLILGATIFQEPLARAAAPFESVFVSNDSANPVPVREQNLDRNGNIKVHEQGTADVNVTNLPSVQSVSVTNLPSVQSVRAADNSAFQPFVGGDEFFSIPHNQAASTHSIAVPVGKRLVIQYVSGSIHLPDGHYPRQLYVQSTLAGVERRSHIVPTKTETYEGTTKFVFGEVLTLYADGGTNVRLTVNRFPNAFGSGTFSWVVTGYLVDLP